MAARAEEPLPLEVLDLRHFQSRDLAPLLEEESRLWAERLRWNFQASADIVRRYLDMKALSGYALLSGRLVVGYAYWVHEDHKILIGDLFVSQGFRTLETQHRLLSHVVETARHTPGVRRIEAQLMMLESPNIESLFAPHELTRFERDFMLAEDIDGLRREMFGPAPSPAFRFLPWSEQYLEAAAGLISAAYHDHLDSRINDQYRSPAGARRFLLNIVQYPGCGAFHTPASRLALESLTGRLCGVSLTSMVAPTVGHITQICVLPQLRGQGLGSELLWRSMEVFRLSGCQAVSLTVTAANAGAVRLYHRVGFRTVRRFRAFVWEL